MLSDNDKANRWIDKIADISNKVAVANKRNVVQTAIATVISVNADDYTVRLLSSPDDGSEDFEVISKTLEPIETDDAVMLHYVGDLTNAYIATLMDGGNVEKPYYLPTGGIPESDMTADVRSKLASAVNTNLLDNWYFVGGGSQQNGGQFPINQRGNTTYSGSGYGIDRWKSMSGNVSVDVNSGNVTISTNSSWTEDYSMWEQVIEQFPNDTTCTLSVMVSACSGSFEFFFGSSGTQADRVYTDTISAAGLYSVSGSLSGITDGIISLVGMTAGVSSISITAIKLEIGSYQTLAHYDSANSMWELREMPNYQDHLVRCMRFYQHYPYYTTSGYLMDGKKDYCMPVYLGAPIHPSATCTATSWVGRKASGGYSSVTSGGTAVSFTSLTATRYGDTHYVVTDTLASSSSDSSNSMLAFYIEDLLFKYDI